MSTLIHPKTITVDGLSVRYAEGGQDGPDAILMSPWPESVYAFEPAWPHLAAAAHLVAIDPPGFGGSDYRQTLMNPKAIGHFILKVADALGLDNPHIVGPTSGPPQYCLPPLPTRKDSAASSSAVAAPRYR
jgi:pimeloyl-ACP methyl ester carboxylesterase